MNIMIASGSHRQNSQSTKVAGAVNQALFELPGCDNSEIFDLANNPLPLWVKTTYCLWRGIQENPIERYGQLRNVF